MGGGGSLLSCHKLLILSTQVCKKQTEGGREGERGREREAGEREKESERKRERVCVAQIFAGTRFICRRIRFPIYFF